MKIELLEPLQVQWDELDRFEDRHIFQTREWVDFVADSQKATPVVARLVNNGSVAGYFTGLVVKRLGVKILGSPFPGWGTPYMGFNMFPGTSRADALEALKTFAFRDLGCYHMEICDRYLPRELGLGAGFRSQEEDWYESDLTQTEEEIFARMAPSHRSNTRKALRCGVVIEEASDLGFAGDYFTQTVEVFARQSLVPAFDRERIEKLIQHLFPTGRLLLLRARDPSGTCIATGLWLGMNKLAFFWGNAMLRAYQHLRPNQALHWYAMRYWKKQGVEKLSWGGGKYKEQYGVTPLLYSRLMKSRFQMIQLLRDGVEHVYAWRHRTPRLAHQRDSSQ